MSDSENSVLSAEAPLFTASKVSRILVEDAETEPPTSSKARDIGKSPKKQPKRKAEETSPEMDEPSTSKREWKDRQVKPVAVRAVSVDSEESEPKSMRKKAKNVNTSLDISSSESEKTTKSVNVLRKSAKNVKNRSPAKKSPVRCDSVDSVEMPLQTSKSVGRQGKISTSRMVSSAHSDSESAADLPSEPSKSVGKKLAAKQLPSRSDSAESEEGRSAKAKSTGKQMSLKEAVCLSEPYSDSESAKHRMKSSKRTNKNSSVKKSAAKSTSESDESDEDMPLGTAKSSGIQYTSLSKDVVSSSESEGEVQPQTKSPIKPLKSKAHKTTPVAQSRKKSSQSKSNTETKSVGVEKDSDISASIKSDVKKSGGKKSKSSGGRADSAKKNSKQKHIIESGKKTSKNKTEASKPVSRSTSEESKSREQSHKEVEEKKVLKPDASKTSDAEIEDERSDSSLEEDVPDAKHASLKKQLKKKPVAISDMATSDKKTIKPVDGSKTVGDDLKRYKTYLKEAGIRVQNYEKFFEGVASRKKRKEKILQLLKDSGLEGNPTIPACRKLKVKREAAAEVASLDTRNIISSRGRTRGIGLVSKPVQAEGKSDGTSLASKPVKRFHHASEEDDESNEADVCKLAYQSDDDSSQDAFANLRDCIESDSD